MKVSELLEQRRENWQELERLCLIMESRRRKSLGAATLSRFAALYRAACADLALADAYQLPTNNVQYLHLLVGRAHNQLYRSRKFAFGKWIESLLVDVPQQIFQDRCVQAVFCLFWGVFTLSAVFASSEELWPGFAESIMGEDAISQMEESFSEPIDGRNPDQDFAMAGFYIQHNTGIGLRCFALGIAVVPGIWTTLFNAASLGAAFGFMARPDVPQGVNFFNFVTAHGPFELTAIVLSAGAGLRIGFSWIHTQGWTRSAALRIGAQNAMPIMGAAMVMFFLAALIEGFVSPSGLPLWSKQVVGIVSSGMLMFYFLVLGYPRRA